MASKVKQKKQKKQEKRERERRTAALPHTCLSCRVTLPIPGTMALPRSPLDAYVLDQDGDDAETRPDQIGRSLVESGRGVTRQDGVHHEERRSQDEHSLSCADHDVRQHVLTPCQ
jgi:hypothetical protein